MAPVPGDVEASLKKVVDTSTKIASSLPGVDLLLFPELCLTGLAPFVPGGEPSLGLTEEIPSGTTDRLCALARTIRRWLVPGSLLERDNGQVYNTSLVISPEGRS